MSEYADILRKVVRQPDQLTDSDFATLRRACREHPADATAPALLLKYAGAALSSEESAFARARVSLYTGSPATLISAIDPSGKGFDSFYPPLPDGNRPSTSGAIDLFLETYGHQSPEEDALLERMIFNPVPDYSEQLARQEDPAAPEKPAEEGSQDALIDSFLAATATGHRPLSTGTEALAEAPEEEAAIIEEPREPEIDVPEEAPAEAPIPDEEPAEPEIEVLEEAPAEASIPTEEPAELAEEPADEPVVPEESPLPQAVAPSEPSELNDNPMPSEPSAPRILDAFDDDDVAADEPAPQAAPPRQPAKKAQAKPVPTSSLLSESLAKIFIKQGRYERAFEIISNLSLNYPEKSIYFADQLRFLEMLIINKRYAK